jgi:Type II restriction endonuclease EcoO109I
MNTPELEALISKSLGDFYERRIQKLSSLRFPTLLRRKNPYLLRALGTQKASELVERLLGDYLSSSDESIFGDAFFEPIARIVSGGKVADGEGVDVVVESETRIMAIAVKSGPNPFSSSQKRRQNDEFNAMRSRLQKIQKQFDPVLAHAYGRKNSPAGGKLSYRDSSGQTFWTEVTGDPDFYLKLIRLMRDEPVKHRDEYRPKWEATVNKFTASFIKDYCDLEGNVDWEKLVTLVSEVKTSRSKP